MKPYPVFAISRQYGSGGRDIGLTLSKKLGIPYYDNELITLAAQESGFAPELFKNADHNASSSLLFSLSMYGSSTGTFNMPLGDQVFLIQSDIIKKVANEGPCVIIGRCADYILRDFPNCVSVFLHAPLDQRLERAVESYGVDPLRAKDIVTKTDKKRSVYYSHFTGEKWGASENYHITIDTARMGISGTTDALALIADQLSKPN
ncbi:AAA family ATPase [Oscillospiraceae bacterium LTW-04]|nr:cytidylate kinase-like family protein [Oscillospiraceae bacterium MB24-C1]